MRALSILLLAAMPTMSSAGDAQQQAVRDAGMRMIVAQQCAGHAAYQRAIDAAPGTLTAGGMSASDALKLVKDADASISKLDPIASPSTPEHVSIIICRKVLEELERGSSERRSE